MNSSGTARENQTESRHSHTNIGNNKPIRLALPHTRWRRREKKEREGYVKKDGRGREKRRKKRMCVNMYTKYEQGKKNSSTETDRQA